ncbi:uncharacterized protein DSM5745_00801 [Aspergillus mulundensis]|uniref:Uncharacterized protein n=1 Tax=Aspergillus mulundensis TaxID=1810919 RepID=A0A3D8T4M1_9EURO|nr:hypothetical protein DSM5745_00801 [Aspergillus mulundensis]RDW93479.1 hypothetical protein DSM5745_00801 [Aspergillus mulundensis]
MIQTKRLQSPRDKLTGNGSNRPSLRAKRPILAQSDPRSSPARPAKQPRLDNDDEESNSDDGDIGSDGQTRPLRSPSKRSQFHASHSPERPSVIVASTPTTGQGQRRDPSIVSPQQRPPHPIPTHPPVPITEGPPKHAQEPAQVQVRSPRPVQMQIDSIVSAKPGPVAAPPAVQAHIPQTTGKPSAESRPSKPPENAVTVTRNPQSPSDNVDASGLKALRPFEPQPTPETLLKEPDASSSPAPKPADTPEPKLTPSLCFRYGLQYLSQYVKFSEQNDEAQTDKTAVLQAEVVSLRDKLEESERRQDQLKTQLELKSQDLDSLKGLLSQVTADFNKQLDDVRADTRKVMKQQEKFRGAEDWKVSDMLNMMAMAKSQRGGSVTPDV